MPKKGWKTQSLRTQTLAKLEEMYSKDPKRSKNQKFTAWLDELLSNVVDYQGKIEEYGPFIEYRGPGDNHLALFDNSLGRYVTITIDNRGKDKKLHCDVDDSNDCVHVGFCFGHKEIYPLLIERGVRPATTKKGRK